jgi:hypothetical protein
MRPTTPPSASTSKSSTPLAGRAACRCAFKNNNVLTGSYHRHPFAPQSSSASPHHGRCRRVLHLEPTRRAACASARSRTSACRLCRAGGGGGGFGGLGGGGFGGLDGNVGQVIPGYGHPGGGMKLFPAAAEHHQPVSAPGHRPQNPAPQGRPSTVGYASRSMADNSVRLRSKMLQVCQDAQLATQLSEAKLEDRQNLSTLHTVTKKAGPSHDDNPTCHYVGTMITNCTGALVY